MADSHSRSAPSRSSRAPLYLRLPHAAVSLDASPLEAPLRAPVRRAQRPLPLGGGRKAVAIRKKEDTVDVLVVAFDGSKVWHPLKEVMSDHKAALWAKTGF